MIFFRSFSQKEAVPEIFFEVLFDYFIGKLQQVSQLVLIHVVNEAKDKIVEVIFTFCFIVRPMYERSLKWISYSRNNNLLDTITSIMPCLNSKSKKYSPIVLYFRLYSNIRSFNTFFAKFMLLTEKKSLSFIYWYKCNFHFIRSVMIPVKFYICCFVRFLELKLERITSFNIASFNNCR